MPVHSRPDAIRSISTGLNNGAAGQNWVETTVNWDTAPGFLVETSMGPRRGSPAQQRHIGLGSSQQRTSLGIPPLSPLDTAPLAVGTRGISAGAVIGLISSGGLGGPTDGNAVRASGTPAASGFKLTSLPERRRVLLADTRWIPMAPGRKSLQSKSLIGRVQCQRRIFAQSCSFSDAPIAPFPGSPSPAGLARFSWVQRHWAPAAAGAEAERFCRAGLRGVTS
jgi:hypothetical protein